MEKIGDILHTYLERPKPTRTITEWQDTALRLIGELGISKSKKGSFFKVVKEKPRGLVEEAYRFAVDYKGNMSRETAFFWRLYHDPGNMNI